MQVHVVFAYYSDGSGEPIALVACDTLKAAQDYVELFEKVHPSMNIAVGTPHIIAITPNPEHPA